MAPVLLDGVQLDWLLNGLGFPDCASAMVAAQVSGAQLAAMPDIEVCVDDGNAPHSKRAAALSSLSFDAQRWTCSELTSSPLRTVQRFVSAELADVALTAHLERRSLGCS